MTTLSDDALKKLSGDENTAYEKKGFVVLKKRVNPVLVQKARESVAKKIEAMRKTEKGNDVFATVCEDKDWPHECGALFEAVENLVPPESFCPKSVKIQIASRIGVYRPTNQAGGRAARNAVFYTISLDVGALVSGANMPSYYQGSYVEDSPIRPMREGLTVEEGDILIWNGMTVTENADTQSGGFMLIKHYWKDD